MKAKLFLLCAAALTFTGCATYTGGTEGDSSTVQGADGRYIDSHHDMGRGVYAIRPVYRIGSPSGNQMGDDRPDIFLHR
jgi:hypothetical protein